MTPLPFVWPHALLFWSVEIWAFVPEYQIIRRAGKTSDVQDAKSKHVIMIGSGLTFPATVLMGFFGPLRIVSHRLAWFYLGIGLLVLGSLLRRHCWRMLGPSFTGNVEARAGQEIVTRGAYSILRHPSYSAALLVNVGVAISFGSWAATILAALVSVAVYSYRMQVEEQALVAAIGAPYQEFMRTRKRIIPYIY